MRHLPLLKTSFRGRSHPSSRPRTLRARYDAAQTTTENKKHWAAADHLSANAALSPDVRAKLRTRARYEFANNCYAHGIGLTVANDTIGKGPRLQCQSDDAELNDRVETLFAEWAEATNMAPKLHTMRVSKFVDGEAFAILTTNHKLDHDVKADFRLIECDQVTSPFTLKSPGVVDGIIFDEDFNPLSYSIMKHHPGETAAGGAQWEFQEYSAQFVLHYFRAIRPGQFRGVSEIASALPLFAQLRRYTLAVIAAAETAADYALVMQTKNMPDADDDDVETPEALDTIELERRMMTVLPEGYELGQAKPEQPTTTYAEFKGEILNEIARCCNVPFNIAAGNSSKYNYASGRLDKQTYYGAQDLERDLVRRCVLEPLFAHFMSEAVLIEGLLPQKLRLKGSRLRHQWFWDGQEHVDPQKEADAQKTRLESNTTTLAEEFGRRGKDWEVELKQRARERKLMTELGLDPAPVQYLPSGQPVSQPASKGKEDDVEE